MRVQENQSTRSNKRNQKADMKVRESTTGKNISQNDIPEDILIDLSKKARTCICGNQMNCGKCAAERKKEETMEQELCDGKLG